MVLSAVPVSFALVVLAATSTAGAEQASQEITKLPSLKKFVAAPYPPRAEKEGVQAAVVLEIDIGADGRVTDARVVEPASPQGYGFDEAALAAVRQFEFEPAEAGGKPIPVTISYKYGFTLAAPASQKPPHVPVLSLAGHLVERGTRLPIAGVTVTVFRGEGESAKGLDATSDKEGAFAFYDLEPGEWKILCDPEGYYPVRTAVTLAAGEVLEVTYHVEKRSYNAFDVTVEARRPKEEVTRRTVTAQEIQKVPGTFGDPIAVVTDLPSVARTPLGSGAVVVRGSSPQDTIITVDGMSIPYLYHFGGIRTALPAGMLQYVDFFPGNFSPYFGRATGGVLDIKLKKLQPERPGGYVDASFLDTSVFFATPVGEQAAIAVSGRRSYVDVILNQVLPKDGPVTMTAAPRYYDYQLLATYRPAAGHELDVAAFGSDDAFKLVFNNPADAAGVDIPNIGLTSRFYRGIVTHQWTFSEGSANELKLSVGWDETRVGFGPERYINSQVWSPNLRDTLTLALGPSISLRLGVDYLIYDANWDVSFRRPPMEGDTPGENNDFNAGGVLTSHGRAKRVQLPAAFAEAELKVTPELTLSPGLRVDYFGWINETVFDPRLTARWRLGDSLALKGGAGVFHQIPTFDQIDAGFGNPDIKSFWAYHYSLGAEYQALPYLSIDVTGFYKDLENVVVVSDALVERQGELVPERYNNNGRGRIYGVDVMIRHELAHNFFGWIAYTLSRSERRDNRSPSYRLFDYDETHILTILGTYRLPHNWELGLRWRYVTGYPYTPVTGAMLDVDTDTYVPLSGAVNTGRQPAFHQLDVRVDKRWIFDSWTFAAYLDIQNVYNRANSDSWTYNYDYSQKTVTAAMPFLAIFGVRADL